jgi:hypothetical protein
MGRYSHRPAEVKERPYEIHPIWRGIGCIMLIIGPFIAFSAAHILVNLDMENGWMAVPREMRGAVRTPVCGFACDGYPIVVRVWIAHGCLCNHLRYGRP